MKRSDFIKTASILTLATQLNAKSIIENEKAFSFQIITENPNFAIKKMDEILSYKKYKNQKISFSESGLSGQQFSDLVFIENHKLLNPKNPRTVFEGFLGEYYNELSLGKFVTNPTLLSFSNKNISSLNTIKIFKHNRLIDSVSLDKNQIISIDDGRSKIKIENKTAKFVKSSCKHKTCMKMGHISSGGDSLICVPEQIHVTISGENAFGVDTFAF